MSIGISKRKEVSLLIGKTNEETAQLRENVINTVIWKKMPWSIVSTILNYGIRNSHCYSCSNRSNWLRMGLEYQTV